MAGGFLSDEALAYVSDALVLLGLAVTTLGVLGLLRMPDTYTKLHATGKAVFLGIIALLVASLASGAGGFSARALLIAAILILTTPVGAHAIGRAAYNSREPMETPGAIDETPGTPLPGADPGTRQEKDG